MSGSATWKHGFSSVLVAAALASPVPQRAASETPPTDPFALLNSLCIQTFADPTAIAAAARSAGLRADETKPGRYFLGAPEAGIVVIASSAHPAPTKAMGETNIIGCTLVVRGVSADSLGGYWNWRGIHPIALPYTAYVQETPAAITRRVDGKEVPYSASEVALDEYLKPLLNQRRVRLISVEALPSGGLKFFYGVVLPVGVSPPTKPPPTVSPVFKAGAERYWPDEHVPIDRVAALDCDAMLDGGLANCAIAFETPHGYGPAAMVLVRQKQVTILPADVPSGDNKRVRFVVHFDWPKLR